MRTHSEGTQVYDKTAAFTVAIDSGTLDVRTFSQAVIMFNNADTGGTSRSLTVSAVFDDGTSFQIMAPAAVNSGTTATYYIGPAGLTAGTGIGVMPRKIRIQVTAGTGASGSARVTVHAR